MTKLIYMADGLFLYEKENSYVVMDQQDNILKTLQSRRAEERQAIEKTIQDKNQS